MNAPQIDKDDALLIVHVQRDFCAGGALEVPDGDSVVTVLNGWIDAARRVGAMVIASRDWHTAEHCSFRSQGGLWPEHCVQDTPGARFHPDLALPDDVVIVSTGSSFDRDIYSAFEGSGLAGFLLRHGVRRLWVGGLAEDVCVKATVEDACRAGFETHLIESATRPVYPEKATDAIASMRQAGAIIERAA